MFAYINHDDLRSLDMMERMIEKGYYVSDNIKDIKYAQILYFGFKGIDSQNRMITHNDTICLCDESMNQISKQACVYTYVYNQYLDCYSKKIGFSYRAFMDSESFLEMNSLLTGEGIVSYLIDHRRYPLYHARVTILGFGHCAKPLIHYLLSFDCIIKVVVRNSRSKYEIEELGCIYENIENMSFEDTDILINTIPSVVVERKHIDKMNKKIMIVDIASYPYGIDHHYALSKGLDCQILAAIPCKYAYAYAGDKMISEVEKDIC